MSNATATAPAPITETESIYIVVSKKGAGHTVATLKSLSEMAAKSGHKLTWRASRVRAGVVMIQMDGQEVSRGFRSRVESFEFYSGLNA